MNYNSQGRQRVDNYRRNTEYVQGNAVRRLRPEIEIEEPVRVVSHRTQRNRDKARYMNPGYVVFLSIAAALVAVMLISYIQVQSDLTICRKQVASMKSELDYLKTTNDENLKRVESSVSLDKIKEIAVEELGMTYAKEGQVIIIEDEGSDYVRQIKNLK